MWVELVIVASIVAMSLVAALIFTTFDIDEKKFNFSYLTAANTDSINVNHSIVDVSQLFSWLIIIFLIFLVTLRTT